MTTSRQVTSSLAVAVTPVVAWATVLLTAICPIHADEVDDRLNQMVLSNVENPWPATGVQGLSSYALACLHANTNLVEANDTINEFHTLYPTTDTSAGGYFGLPIIWRIYCDPTMNSRLTASAREDIEELMWGYIRTRSKVSDANGSEWTIVDSENHDMLQKGSYLVCAQALKNAGALYGPDRALADGNTLAEHAAAWNEYFVRYFSERAREGINCEMASPTYAKYTLGVYYNIRDFAESEALRDLADQFLTLYWADTASDFTLSGVRGGAETRCYKDNYLRLGSQYPFYPLLWGYGWHTTAGTVRTHVLIPAVSSYRVPEIITACASDTNRPNFLYTSRRFGLQGTGTGGYVVGFDDGNSNMRRDTYVTPDYTMGTLTLDMNEDYITLIDQNRAMGVFFASGVNQRVMVYGKGADSNNKSYADLNGVCRENCMVVQRDKGAYSSGNATLIYVAGNLWGNRVETNGWVFTQSGNAYCAIKPAGGGYTAASAPYGYELTLGDMWAPVVVQMGQASNYAGFAAFQSSVKSNPFTYTADTLTYTSEAGETFTAYGNSTTTPKVNGATVELNPTKTYDSPYLSMIHGEDIATFSYGSYSDLVLDFSIPIEPGSIRVINSGSKQHVGTKLTTLSFDAGDADKLVVTVSSERSYPGDIVITYNGVELTPAVSGASRCMGVWYLDHPYTGGAADLTVDMTNIATVNGIGLGVVSIAGVAPGVSANARDTATNVSIATVVNNSFVMAGYGENGSGGVSAASPLTQLYSGDIGSSVGCAGYTIAEVPGSNTYAFAGSAAASPGTAVAVFIPDGLSVFDAWTVHYFASDPFVSGSRDSDPDNDLHSNFDEYIAGTDPTNNLDVFRVEITESNGEVVVSIPSRLTTSDFYGPLTRCYGMESTTNLLGTNWVPVVGAENLPATGGELRYTNKAGAARMYYRGRTWLSAP